MRETSGIYGSGAIRKKKAVKKKVQSGAIRTKKAGKKKVQKNRRGHRYGRGHKSYIVPVLISAAQIRRIRFANLKVGNQNEDEDGALLERALARGLEEESRQGINDDEVDLESIEARAAEKWEQEKTKFDHLFRSKKKNGGISGKDSEQPTNGDDTEENVTPVMNDGVEDDPGSRILHFNAVPSPINASKKKKEYFRFVTAQDEACKFCSHICGRSTPLQRHLDRHHQIRCETCVKEFGTRLELKQHQKEFHATRHRCDLCERDFVTLQGYKGHVKVSDQFYGFYIQVKRRKLILYVEIRCY